MQQDNNNSGAKRVRSNSPTTEAYLQHKQEQRDKINKDKEQEVLSTMSFEKWSAGQINKAVKYARGKQLLQILQKETNPLFPSTRSPEEVIEDLQSRYLEQLLWSALSYKLDTLGFTNRTLRTSTVLREHGGKTVLSIAVIVSSSEMDFADRDTSAQQ